MQTEYLFEYEDEPTLPDSDEEDTHTHTEQVTDPEVWADYWSEELVTLWHVVEDQCKANGYAILEKCTFPKFAEFCWENSSKYPPRV